MKQYIIGLVAAAAVAACSALPSGGSRVGKSQEFIGSSKWVLADQVKGQTPTLEIESNKITGTGGCNRYSGEIVLDATAGNFSAKNIASTKMACDNMPVETNFFSMLQEANKYVVNGNTLELYRNQLLLMKLNRQ